MTRDDNKKILSISYNYLNKPEIITTDSGSIYYVYDGTGNLRQKRISKGGSVEKYDYSGKIVFLDSVPQYILNEEGRVRPVASDTTGNYTRYVYDYFIKDHLGNVRSTVTANPINSGYMALHEVATANLEQLVFDNIPSVRETKPGSSNPNDGMAAHLIASDPDQRVGTAIMLRVMPGDKFSLSANTYYEGDYNEREETGSGPALESLLSALMGGGTYAGVPVSELPENIQTVQGIFANPALASRVADLQAINDDPTVPKAHLNYLFFNDNFELQPALSGAIQVGPSIGGGWQSTGNHNACNCTATAPAGSGFVIIYIDNQSIGKDVWFDNIHVEHYTSSVLEESHYYPFGLTVGVGQSAQTNLPNQPYKLTTKELETALDLNVYNFGARMQDMQLGRWWGVDEKAEDYKSTSPYVYVGNNPVKYLDPNGKEWRIGYFAMGRGAPELKASAIYRDGTLYNDDGSKYTGSNTYLLTVQNDLKSLKNQNAITGGIIEQLDNSSNTHMIANMDFKDSKTKIEADEHYDQKNNNRTVSETENPGDSYTKYTASDENWGLDLTTNSFKVTTRDRKSGLMHEIVHAYDKDINKPRSETTRDEEGRALSIENTVEGNRGRTNHGRATYTREELDNYKKQVENDVQNNSR